jgi:excisionase family DNA binding protein
MPTTHLDDLNTVTPSEDEAKLAEESSRLLAARLARAREFRLQIDGGKGEPLVIPAAAAKVLFRVLTEMGRGNAVSLVPIHAELSTQQAADLLNVSRPHLVKLLDEGKIPSHKVGTHRRVRSADLLAYKKEVTDRRLEALDELAALSQELKMGS